MLFLLFLRCSRDATWVHVFGEGEEGHLPLPLTVVWLGEEEENWYSEFSQASNSFPNCFYAIIF